MINLGIMVNPSMLYEHTGRKRCKLYWLLQHHLDILTAHDVEAFSVRSSYRQDAL